MECKQLQINNYVKKAEDEKAADEENWVMTRNKIIHICNYKINVHCHAVIMKQTVNLLTTANIDHSQWTRALTSSTSNWIPQNHSMKKNIWFRFWSLCFMRQSSFLIQFWIIFETSVITVQRWSKKIQNWISGDHIRSKKNFVTWNMVLKTNSNTISCCVDRSFYVGDLCRYADTSVDQ